MLCSPTNRLYQRVLTKYQETNPQYAPHTNVSLIGDVFYITQPQNDRFCRYVALSDNYALMCILPSHKQWNDTQVNITDIQVITEYLESALQLIPEPTSPDTLHRALRGLISKYYKGIMSLQCSHIVPGASIYEKSDLILIVHKPKSTIETKPVVVQFNYRVEIPEKGDDQFWQLSLTRFLGSRPDHVVAHTYICNVPEVAHETAVYHAMEDIRDDGLCVSTSHDTSEHHKVLDWVKRYIFLQDE